MESNKNNRLATFVSFRKEGCRQEGKPGCVLCDQNRIDLTFHIEHDNTDETTVHLDKY